LIDLCVVNYNTRPLLNRFLDCLHNDLYNTPKVWKLHVADNGSTDDSVDWLEYNKDRYKIDNVLLNENIGYSAACNELASIGTQEIICLLNADVWMSSSAVLQASKVFDNSPQVHVMGPKQRDEQGSITHAGIIGTNVQPRHRGWKEHDPEDKAYKDRVECVTVSGSAYFIRRSVWNTLSENAEYKKLFPEAKGAFLPTPHYYEETWCSYFARHLGFHIYYDGRVSIGHSWHASSPKPGQGISEADAKFPISREIFRKACDHFGIERD